MEKISSKNIFLLILVKFKLVVFVFSSFFLLILQSDIGIHGWCITLEYQMQKYSKKNIQKACIVHLPLDAYFVLNVIYFGPHSVFGFQKKLE